MAEMKSQNLWGWIAVFLVILGICAGTAMALSGSGTEEEPWLIQSLADFDEFAGDPNYWDDYTRLETDVNLAGRVYERAVIAWDEGDDEVNFQGTAFTGVFDGNEHKILNLTIDSNDRGDIGLFGHIDGGGVKNLGIEGRSVRGKYGVGGLVGSNWTGSISVCYSTCDVNGNGEDQWVGGLVGINVYGSVSNCYCTGDVSGGVFCINVGGLLGGNLDGTVSQCYSTGDVNGYEYVGGLVGWNVGSVSNCYSTGGVDGYQHVGGLVAISGGSVSNCYSNGDVNGYTIVGGLVARNMNSISDCYSTGDVNGVEKAGGLVAFNSYPGSISNSFWDTDTQTHGITESIYTGTGTATNVHGLPTSQLQQQSTFTDWDFIGVWDIGENQTYPYLRTVPAGDMNKDKTVNFLDVCIIAEQWCNQE